MNYYERVQSAIDYIEENLEQDITLEDLAKQTFFSTFHFHRLFHAAIDDTVMDYIRKRRLSGAAQELANTQKEILDIALQYRFGSQDTFTRAFKRFYNMTPAKYRKIKRQLILFKRKDMVWEANKMYDWSFAQRIQCNDSEKKECLELLKTMVQFSEKTRRYGLMSLEADINETLPFLLRKGLQLVINGVEPKLIREILEAYLLSGDYRGKELLERTIIIEGILTIQMGVHPWLLREKLSGYFCEGFANEIERYFGLDEESEKKKLQSFLDEIKNNPPTSKATALLEEPFAKLDNRSLQRLLREIDIIDIVRAMKGASGKTQARLFENLPQKAVMLVKEDMEAVGNIDTPQIVEAQNKVLSIIQKLRDDGDIKYCQ